MCMWFLIDFGKNNYECMPSCPSNFFFFKIKGMSSKTKITHSPSKFLWISSQNHRNTSLPHSIFSVMSGRSSNEVYLRTLPASWCATFCCNVSNFKLICKSFFQFRYAILQQAITVRDRQTYLFQFFCRRLCQIGFIHLIS